MPNINFVKDGEVVDASVRILFEEAAEQLSNELYYKDHGFTEINADIPEEKFSTVSGVGKGSLTTAGQSYAENIRYKGYASTVNLRKYTSELAYTEEDLHWIGRAGATKRILEFKNNVADHVNALNANINDDCAKIDYLGFGTTFFGGAGDSVPVYDQAHPIRKSGATANPNTFYTGFGTSTTHLAFDEDALVEAIQRMNRFTLNDNTQMKPGKRFRILCSSENLEKVARVLRSAYGPDTSHLGLNDASATFQAGLGRKIDVKMIPDMPYAYKDYWFLVDLDRAQRMRWIVWGWKPRLNNQSEYRKGTYYNDGSVLMAPHIADWRAQFGSKGDGTTVA
ncbi:MAG: hypothetical protein U9O94_01835 [Nanoarchaeota archaeon]|nr:hypothetical protein [Nanoarchaeota archaeon]